MEFKGFFFFFFFFSFSFFFALLLLLLLMCCCCCCCCCWWWWCLFSVTFYLNRDGKRENYLFLFTQQAQNVTTYNVYSTSRQRPTLWHRCMTHNVYLSFFTNVCRIRNAHPSRKHAYLDIYKTENFQTKKWYFSYFCSKHRLWVLLRTASPRRF